jgi:MFS transporter, PAT family, beta-lactamase induction signal transducer AmpG
MNLLEKRGGRLGLFTLLYLSEGAPIGFIWWALPTWLRSEGVPIGQVTGLTALLVLPWAFKFLWAPAVDALRTPRWGFRAWIITAQILMGLTLLPFLWIDVTANLRLAAALLFAHAVCAATQDVAVDALVISTSPEHERGLLNGSMQAGMLVGRSAFGGGVLIVADRLGWNTVFLALIACIWCTMTLLLWVKVPATLNTAAPGRAFLATLRQAFGKRTTWLGLAFALVSAAAFEATGALAGPYLIDHGVSKEEIGWFLGFVAVGCTLVGGLLGGRLSDRWGRARAVGVFLAGFVVMVAALGTLGLVAPEAGALERLALLAGMYFFIGLFTASSYALFMDLTDRRLGATQFSTFMAATNGCESWSAKAGGAIAGRAGYEWAFLALCAVSLASLAVLRAIGRRLGRATEE